MDVSPRPSRPDVRGALWRYARLMHDAHGGSGQYGLSPVGAWITLALAATAAHTDQERGVVEAALGMTTAQASEVTREPLTAPHPDLHVATAVWTAIRTRGAVAWSDQLPHIVERGPIPTQAEADAWARRSTTGQVDRLPLALDDGLMAALVNIVAFRLRWRSTLDVVPATVLRSRWAGHIRHVLVGAGHGHSCRVVDHPEAGLVGVHQALTSTGFTVTSVIGDPDVSSAAVTRAACDVARNRYAPVALYDLPPGPGHAWETRALGPHATADTAEAVLPAWTVENRLDITQDAALGFIAAGAAFARLFGAPQARSIQAVTAGFDATSISAVATTAILIPAALGPAQPKFRHLRVRFERPYAVLVTAPDAPATSTWAQLPLLSAWITKPVEAGTPHAHR